LTAHGTKGDEQRARAEGCTAFYPKPVSTRDLGATVTQLLAPRYSS
jgi:CheY-like chemotaxis protein